MKGDFGVFALNIEEMKNVEIWQPELVLEQYAPQMLLEKVANEMDPNLILIRLGNAMEKEKLLEKSTPISTVQDQDTFIVSFRRAAFEKKRDAQAFTRLNQDSKASYFTTLEEDLDLAQKAFDLRFDQVFLKD